MPDEIPRRSFFSAMAFSPLALLGLQKKSDKTDLRVKRMYDTKEFYRKRFDDMLGRVQTADESADYWECRAVTAEMDADLWRDLCDSMGDRALAAEKKLELVKDSQSDETDDILADLQGTPDEDILSGQIKSFSTIDDMLDSLKRPWDESQSKLIGDE